MSELKGFPITFNIYALNEEEVATLKKAIVDFINTHAKHGRAVTAEKVTKALNNWDNNLLVKNQIINYFK